MIEILTSPYFHYIVAAYGISFLALIACAVFIWLCFAKGYVLDPSGRCWHTAGTGNQEQTNANAFRLQEPGTRNQEPGGRRASHETLWLDPCLRRDDNLNTPPSLRASASEVKQSRKTTGLLRTRGLAGDEVIEEASGNKPSHFSSDAYATPRHPELDSGSCEMRKPLLEEIPNQVRDDNKSIIRDDNSGGVRDGTRDVVRDDNSGGDSALETKVG